MILIIQSTSWMAVAVESPFLFGNRAGIIRDLSLPSCRATARWTTSLRSAEDDNKIKVAALRLAEDAPALQPDVDSFRERQTTKRSWLQLLRFFLRSFGRGAKSP